MASSLKSLNVENQHFKTVLIFKKAFLKSMYVMSVKRQEVQVGKEKAVKTLELLAQRHFFQK